MHTQNIDKGETLNEPGVMFIIILKGITFKTTILPFPLKPLLITTELLGVICTDTKCIIGLMYYWKVDLCFNSSLLVVVSTCICLIKKR